MKTLYSAAALLFLLLASSSIASAQLDVIIGGFFNFIIETIYRNTVGEIITAGLTFLLELYKSLMLMNPDPADIKPLADSIVKMLVPVYVIAIMLTGFYWLFLSMAPRSRARAKSMLLKLLISMPMVMSSTAIFEFLLDLSSLLTNLMLSMGGQVSVSGFSALILTSIPFVILAAPYTLIVLLAIVLLMVLVAILRYIILFFLAAIFPLIIFLFLFDFDLTKDLGEHLMRYTLAAAFAPVLQAFFIVFTMTALSGGVDYRQFLSMGGTGTLAAALAQMAIIFGGCLMVILSPLMMLGLMKWVGLFMVGWAFGNMGVLSHRFGPAGEALGTGLVGAGALLAGEGPGAVPLAGTLWFVQQLSAHSDVGHGTEAGAFTRYARNRGWPPRGMDGGGGGGHSGGGHGSGGGGHSGPGGGGGGHSGGGGGGPGGGGPKITASSDPMEHIGRAEKLLSQSGKKPPTKSAVKEAIEYIKTGLSVGDGVNSAGQPKLDNKNKAKAYILLGDAYSTLGNTGKAITAYEQATQLDPSRHDYKLKLADSYYKKG